MKQAPPLTEEAAEELAIQALTFLAAYPVRLGSFLAATGIGPSQIRAASGEPGFLAGVLDFLASDDRLIVDFGAATGADPADVARAYATLSGARWEREVP